MAKIFDLQTYRRVYLNMDLEKEAKELQAKLKGLKQLTQLPDFAEGRNDIGVRDIDYLKTQIETCENICEEISITRQAMRSGNLSQMEELRNQLRKKVHQSGLKKSMR